MTSWAQWLEKKLELLEPPTSGSKRSSADGKSGRQNEPKIWDPFLAIECRYLLCRCRSFAS